MPFEPIQVEECAFRLFGGKRFLRGPFSTHQHGGRGTSSDSLFNEGSPDGSPKGSPEDSMGGRPHLSRKMLEHYSYVRLEAKRRAVESVVAMAGQFVQ